MKEIILTGIKPSGAPHLGNYFGMIKPALDLVDKSQALYFIADINAGLDNYPVLMAADILLFGTRKRIGIRR